MWDSQHPGIVDYVNVVVDYAVQPSQRHVTLGDIICFQSPLVTSTGLPLAFLLFNPLSANHGYSHFQIFLPKKLGIKIDFYLLDY